MQRDGFGLGQFESSLKLFRQDPEVHNNADVVKQAGEIGFSGIAERNLAGEMAANEGTSQGMFPEGHRIDAAFAGHHVEDTA